MPTSREVLESTYRTGRMKKVRIFVYVIQIVLIIIMMFALTILIPEAGFDPLYLPFGAYLFIIALMLLIVNAEGFFFKLFGIRWAKSDSERFLSAKDYTRWAIVIIIVAAVIMVAVIVMAPIVDENIDTTKNAVVRYDYNYTFQSQDPFGMTGVKLITVTSDNGVPLDIFILHKDDFINGDYGKRLNPSPDESEDITELRFERESYLSYDDYILYVHSDSPNASITYSTERSVSQTLVLYLTVFPVIFIVMNVIWVIYLWPLKKKYEKTSIYE